MEIENHIRSWSGPYGGVPQFDKIQKTDFRTAVELAITNGKAGISVIASNAEVPSFANTMEALERVIETEVYPVRALFSIYKSNLSDEAMQKLEEELEPRLVGLEDDLYQNEALFARIEALAKSAETEASGLNAEQKRLVNVYYQRFVRNGARVAADQKAVLSEINQRLSKLATQFKHNILADEGEIYTLLSESDLEGMPEEFKEGAKASAVELKLPENSYAILNTRSSVEPFLTSCKRRDLRQIVWEKFVKRGDGSEGFKNNAPIIAETLQLRAKRAKILGFESYVHQQLDDTMAKTPDNALKLMQEVWSAAVKRVAEEVADMKKIAATLGDPEDIQPWDYRYYAEKVRVAHYDLDMDLVKPYFQLDKMIQALFYTAGRLFNVEFIPLEGHPVFHEDVRAWEVKRDGNVIALFYMDPYARKGKSSGAWMMSMRNQTKFLGQLPIITNNANFIKGDGSSPLLISFDDANTLFHEFGHGCHGILSHVTYPSLAGTNVVVDYVEFPSQLMEHWLCVDEVLAKYALNQNGESMPPELLAKLLKTQKFNKGFETVEYLASALVDMKLHLAANEGQTLDPLQFEVEALKEIGMPKEIVMRHRLSQFSHLFEGDQYSARYWSYLWADTIVADAWEVFTQQGKGPFDREIADRLYTHVFTKGNTIEPSEGYKLFSQHDGIPIQGLLRKRFGENTA